MSNNKIKAIIFDVDGVVFKTHDESGNYLWSQSVKEDLGLTSKHFSLIFSEKWESIIRGKIKLDAHLHSVFQEKLFKDLDITPEQYIQYWLSNDHHVNQDILDLVKSLKIPCYLGTNQEALRAAHILDTVGSYFQECFASYKIGCIKPEQGFFQHIQKALSLLPHELLLIDDTKNNTIGAQDCGWHVYHYQNDTSGLMDFLKKYEVIMDRNINKETLGTYLSLCTEVYDLSKPNPPEDAYAFYRDYAMNANGPILEPMCGTGRFLLPLLEEGFNVHGFDASNHMLEVLHAKATPKNLKPTVWKGFVEDLQRPEKYNLIFIPSGSFCLIINPVQVEKSLKAIYDHLADGGIFLFEAETLHAVPQAGIWRGSVWPKPNGQKIILSQLATMQDNICTSLCKYELMEAGKIIHTEIEELRVKIYEQDQLTKMLQAVGFKHIRTLKAFDQSSGPAKQDESIVYECRK